MADVFVVGIAVVDFVFAVDPLPKQAAKHRAEAAEIVGGGCAANAAVAVARLGGRARLGARLGDDALGDLVLADLQAEGVDTSLVSRTAGGQSSFSSVLVDKSGERQIVNFRGSGLAAEPDWGSALPRADAVLVDTRWPQAAMQALDLARAQGVPGIVDAEEPMDAALLVKASHVAFSRDGLLAFAGGADLREALHRADKLLPGWVAVTDGAQGVLFATADGVIHVPAFQVPVKDTLAAGDIWHGAFALALAEGAAEMNAARFANAAAALKCTEFGGRKGCPDRDSVAQFLKEKSL